MHNNTAAPFILASGRSDRGRVQVEGQLQQQWGKVCATVVLDAHPHHFTSPVSDYNLLFFVACKAPSAADGAGDKEKGN